MNLLFTILITVNPQLHADIAGDINAPSADRAYCAARIYREGFRADVVYMGEAGGTMTRELYGRQAARWLKINAGDPASRERQLWMLRFVPLAPDEREWVLGEMRASWDRGTMARR